MATELIYITRGVEGDWRSFDNLRWVVWLKMTSWTKPKFASCEWSPLGYI